MEIILWEKTNVLLIKKSKKTIKNIQVLIITIQWRIGKARITILIKKWILQVHFLIPSAKDHKLVFTTVSIDKIFICSLFMNFYN